MILKGVPRQSAIDFVKFDDPTIYSHIVSRFDKGKSVTNAYFPRKVFSQLREMTEVVPDFTRESLISFQDRRCSRCRHRLVVLFQL